MPGSGAFGFSGSVGINVKESNLDTAENSLMMPIHHDIAGGGVSQVSDRKVALVPVSGSILNVPFFDLFDTNRFLVYLGIMSGAPKPYVILIGNER